MPEPCASLFTLRGFKRPYEAVIPGLCQLEQMVMDEVWHRGEVSVRDIHGAFNERRAYTTLMTTLDRLYTKKLLARRKCGRAYLYAPHVSREEVEQSIVLDVVEELLHRGQHMPLLLLTASYNMSPRAATRCSTKSSNLY